MHRGIAIAAAVTLIASGALAAPAEGAVKAGGTCTKVKQVRSVGATRFRCTLQMGRLVWVRVPAKSASVPATPAPSQSAPVKTPLDQAWDRYAVTAQASYDEIQKHIPAADPSKLTVRWHIGASVPKDVLEFNQASVAKAARLLGTLVTRPQDARIFLYTEKDIATMPAITQDISGVVVLFNEAWARGERTGQCPGTAANFSVLPGERTGTLNGGMYVWSGVTVKTADAWCKHVLVHEWFHAFQDYWVKAGNSFAGWPSREAFDVTSIPAFREGSADAVTLAIGGRSFADYIAAVRNEAQGMVDEVPLYQSIKKREDVAAAMRSIESRSMRDDAHNASYATGRSLFEYLIATYGFEKYIQLTQTVVAPKPFRLAFEQVYGFSLDAAYEQASEHIFSLVSAARLMSRCCAP